MLNGGQLAGLTREDAESRVNEVQDLRAALPASGRSCDGWPRRADKRL
jgi:hypothetical protein